MRKKLINPILLLLLTLVMVSCSGKKTELSIINKIIDTELNDGQMFRLVEYTTLSGNTSKGYAPVELNVSDTLKIVTY